LVIWRKKILNLEFSLQISIAISHRCFRPVPNHPVLFEFPLLAIPFAESP
jgi:hypothetical protein